MQVSKKYIAPVCATLIALALISRFTKPPSSEAATAARGEPEIFTSIKQSLPITNLPEEQGWDVAGLIRLRAGESGVDPEQALWVAYCESGFQQYAKNPLSTAKGVYQFIDGTWKYIGAEKSQFDVEENIKQFMIWFPRHPEWWSQCNQKH